MLRKAVSLKKIPKTTVTNLVQYAMLVYILQEIVSVCVLAH